MTKHSKNNTASSIFSYAEYKKLDYGTKRQRLGNESMRQFDACSLCLQRAREPLACSAGHLFCKECVYTDLCMCIFVFLYSVVDILLKQVAQKKDIKRQKERFDALLQEEEEEKERVKAAARQRVLHNFERGQLGLGLGHLLDAHAKNGGGADVNERASCATFSPCLSFYFIFPIYCIPVKPGEQNESLISTSTRRKSWLVRRRKLH